MTELTALRDDSSDPTATHCLACAAPVGHLAHCPATDPDATTLLIEQLPGDLTRTWMVSGLRYNLTPARRARYTAQMGQLHWVRPTPGLKLPMSIGLLVNDVLAQWGIARHVAEIGYGGMVPGTDCGCSDWWRCRCDFPQHPFRYAPPDFWPDYGLLAFKVRGQSRWLRMWLLDTGLGAVYIAEDHTPQPPVPRPISRACFMHWCDTCPGTVTTTDEQADCHCPHHTTSTPMSGPVGPSTCKEPAMPRIRKILELSTDHLPEHLCDNLSSIDHVVAYHLVTGWLLWVPNDPDASSAAMDVPIPGEILAVQRHARSLDCDYVLLHADADRDDHLPTWER